MQAFYQGKDMKSVDQYAMQTMGIPSVALMDAAASSMAMYIRHFLKGNSQARLLILCGKGNNGGDGFCLTRFLSDYSVSLAPCYPPDSTLTSDAFIYANVAKNMHIPTLTIYGQQVQELSALFSQFDLIIDAIYGIGFSGEVRYQKVQNIINAANQSNVPIISVDVPSGIDATTGYVASTAIKATKTITFAALKTGMMLYPAYDYCGQIDVVDIGISLTALQMIPPSGYLVDKSFIQEHMPPRFSTSHKTSYGKALCIGGSQSMKGSILLSARTAMRSGCGFVKLASLESVCSLAMFSSPELLTCPLMENKKGGLSAKNITMLKQQVDQASAVAIGPGMGSEPDTHALVAGLCSLAKPFVIDADALNVIADDLSILSDHQGEMILTPHEMEMARLCHKDISYVHQNRLEAASYIAQTYQVVVVLKGAHTIVASADHVYMIPTGNPGMSTAGAGDTLTGLLVGLLAQGMAAEEAAIVGAYIHGQCGDEAAKKVGYMALTASDIITAVPAVLQSFESY